MVGEVRMRIVGFFEDKGGDEGERDLYVSRCLDVGRTSYAVTRYTLCRARDVRDCSERR